MSYEKYGLSKTNASSSDHDKGIVKGPDGNYYQIDGFNHDQKQGLDADQGDVFKSSLYEDSGANYSNFNTATDVENALNLLDSEPSTTEVDDTPYEPSDEIKQARERVKNWEEKDYGVYGATDREKELEASNNGDKTSANYLDNYKMNLREKAASGKLGRAKTLK